jgi:hypothetical protein
LHPPAPFINVTLRNPVTGVAHLDVPAQLDSAPIERFFPWQWSNRSHFPRSAPYK